MPRADCITRHLPYSCRDQVVWGFSRGYKQLGIPPQLIFLNKRWGSYCVAQAGFKPLASSDSLASTFQSAGITGVVNVLLTTPLWVVNTRLKLQGAKFRNEDIVPTNYKGIIDAFHQIIRDEGISALWNGTFPSLLLVFNPAIQFMFYEGLKRQLLKKRMKLSSLDVFIIGAVAKAIATTLTYPMQTVQSILRFGRHRLNPENRTLGSLRNILYLLHQRVRRFGILGLYKGLEAKLLQTVLTAALMFLVYEKLTAATFTVMGLKRAHTH
ncbi:peroxisomal membrane protein PMP34 isoform X3 [Macaca fascicularis]|uniref:peroxisomal membrane protein PMP34 isoform X3 n=1 Tax=Macaca fascicularis TaxID=9541 RepID=UPI0032B05A2F